MNSGIAITLSVLALASILFISGRVRADLVALGALIALMLFGILTPGEALSGFSNTVVIMMAGLFVVGGGIFQTGLAKLISRKLLLLAGSSETRLLIVIMLATGMMGAFISNTGTIAVMMPIVVSMAMSAGVNPARLLMPLAFASSMGGALTLIGTPPNLVIQDVLRGGGHEGLGFFSFTPIGLVGLATGIVCMLFLRRWLPSQEDGRDAQTQARSTKAIAAQYQLAQNLYRVRVDAQSPIRSKKLGELALSGRYRVNIIEVRRRMSVKNQFFKTIPQEVATSETELQEGDILYVHGAFADVQAFADAYMLPLLDHHAAETAFTSGDIGIAEVLLTPSSSLVGKLVAESGFREKYRLNILGIRRKDEVILHHLKDERMRYGDAMLVQGTWEDIALLAEETDVVVVGQPAEEARKVTLDHKAPIAAGIMLLMIGLLIVDIIPAVASVMICAVLMVVFGCLRSMEDAYKTMNWESIVLIAGMIPVSIAIEKTGAAELLSTGLVGMLGSFGPLVMLAGIYMLTSLLTLFISNTACAVLVAPIALASAAQLGVSPYAFLFAVAVGASMCFAVPFSTPPNALVMSAGRYVFMDYIKVGLPLQIIMGVVMIAVLPLFFPF
ncbi:SLC13 family permease [Xylanibacillus composti]|uniref:SLC13 family permease n=1 Tax=Xylanibacillus composti TaxID=1572762 RepID=A0A8J4H5H8_9BACL|nr:SLC13 family permease [Xylanibacillus composti]MDT9725318.1 SLC13 family permease [Xylanibacillus composti]GIQ71189.1 SLC13 family permease [Xylanibacillus composti]